MIKHLILKESPLALSKLVLDVSSGHDFIEIKLQDDQWSKKKDINGIIFIQLDHDKSFDFNKLKKIYPKNKIILLSQLFSDKVIKDLQAKKEAFDLFFKYPCDFKTVWKMYSLISAEATQDIKNISSNTTNLDIASLPDDSGEFEFNNSASQMGEDILSEIDLEKELLGATSRLSDTDESRDKITNFENSSPSPDEISRILVADLLDSELGRSVKKDDQDQSMMITEKTVMRPPKIDDVNITKAIDVSMSDVPLINQSVKYIKNKSSDLDENLDFKNIIDNKDAQILKLVSHNRFLKDQLNEMELKLAEVDKKLSFLELENEKMSSGKDEQTIELQLLKKKIEKDKNTFLEKESMLVERNKFLEKKIEHLKENLVKKENQNYFDLKKVRAREEDLEDKISLLQADAAMQLQNREQRIVALKRKVDVIEFELAESLAREKEFADKNKKLELCLDKVSKSLGGLMNTIDDSPQAEISFLENKKI